jgi:curved DNA-binding protein CbpA
MSAEQESTFKKFRDADDAGGNLGWSSRMSRKALKHAQDAPPGVEDWELSDGEKVLWRLMKIPRKYIDLENTGVMPAEQARGFLRGLVSADVLDVLELDDAKPIVPLEVKRLVGKVTGTEAPKKKSGRLKARVYRPDISGGNAESSKPASPPPAAARPPVEGVAPAKPAPKPAAAKAKSAPKESSPRDDEKAAAIEKRFAAMRGQNHYDFLEIQPSAQAEGIKKAYMKLAKELHPDRFAGSDLDPEVIEKADKLFKRLQNAWSTLNNDGQRKQYDAKIAAGGGDDGADGKVRRPDEAKVMYLKAEHLAKAKQWAQAEKHYKTALQLDDSVIGAKVGLAWATYFNEQKDKTARSEEARAMLDEVVRKERHGDAAYKLALIARLEGNTAEHEKRIMQAVKLSPRHQEALAESRLLQKRKGPGSKVKGATAKDGKGGLFGRLKR